MLELIKKIYYDNLTFYFKCENIGEKGFSNFDDAFRFFQNNSNTT